MSAIRQVSKWHTLVVLLMSLLWVGCAPAQAAEPTPTLYLLPTAAPTRMQTVATYTMIPPTITPSITPTATETSQPTATPIPPYDYAPMLDAVSAYIEGKKDQMPQLEIGFAFVDVQTGQTLHVNGAVPHYSLSAFKGVLGAMYFSLLEQGAISELETDFDHLYNMLNWSSNPDTTCVIKRVGGLAAFNDWMADHGFSREGNFVFRWQAWGCSENGTWFLPDDDWRYARGDAALGLPGNYELMACVRGIFCDKTHIPVELAGFYARAYRGEYLNADYTGQWLEHLIKSRDGSPFYDDLPEDGRIHVYSKDGYLARTETIALHFYNEAGIIETPHGAFTLAIFMRGNPNFPGDAVIGDLARIAYDYFVDAHD